MCDDDMFHFLDDDIKSELLMQLQKLKTEYSLIKENLINNACKMHTQRHSKIIQSGPSTRIVDLPTDNSNSLCNTSKWMFDEELWKTAHGQISNQDACNLNIVIDESMKEMIKKEIKLPITQSSCESAYKLNSVDAHNERSRTACRSNKNSEGSVAEDNSQNVRRSNRIQANDKLSCKPITSPVLCIKMKLKKKKCSRKYFPYIPIELLRKMTNIDSTTDFSLPDAFKEYFPPDMYEGTHPMDGLEIPYKVMIDQENFTGNQHKNNQKSYKSPIGYFSSDHLPGHFHEYTAVKSSLLGGNILSNISIQNCEVTKLLSVCDDSFNKDDDSNRNKVKENVARNDNKKIQFHQAALACYKSHGYMALLLASHTTIVYKCMEKQDDWIKIWECQSKIDVDAIHWMMSERTDDLYLLKINYETSLFWISIYNLSTNVGNENIFQMLAANLLCVCTLPMLEIVINSTELVKYRWDEQHRKLEKEVVMMEVEETIISLCILNRQPNALIGSSIKTIFIWYYVHSDCEPSSNDSTQMFYIHVVWNHATGFLLQQISLKDVISLKNLLDATSCEGIIICHIIGDFGFAACASIACNPFNGTCTVISRAKSPSSDKRMMVNVSTVYFKMLHDPWQIMCMMRSVNFSLVEDIPQTKFGCCYGRPSHQSCK